MSPRDFGIFPSYGLHAHLHLALRSLLLLFLLLGKQRFRRTGFFLELGLPCRGGCFSCRLLYCCSFALLRDLSLSLGLLQAPCLLLSQFLLQQLLQLSVLALSLQGAFRLLLGCGLLLL